MDKIGLLLQAIQREYWASRQAGAVEGGDALLDGARFGPSLHLGIDRIAIVYAIRQLLEAALA
jgi:hypothetical protein